MIAVPMPFIIQRDNEQVSVFEIVQGFSCPEVAEIKQNGITQRAAQAVKDGRAQQKV